MQPTNLTPTGTMRSTAVGAGVETAGLLQENRKILVSVGRPISDSVINYAVNLAERLGYDLIALNVRSVCPKGLFHSPYHISWRKI